MALVPVNEQLGRFKERARRFASGFTAGQKAVTIAAAVLVVAGAVLFMSLSSKPTYAPLFTNLQPQDAANITAKLQSANVPFQLADGGSTIMVPANDVAKERLAMAEAGLPAQSTVGLSILDKEGITASDLTQQADYLRALQGELEQTIDAISGVESSQVTIALPANQNFALTNDNPTGASVLVTMSPGQSLSGEEVQAIVHLVASSVPNLSSNEVTVADSNGNLLAGPGVGNNSAVADSATASYDGAVQQKVESYLAAVLGPNNADVQVNATLNYDKVSTTTQRILPGANGQPASFCTSTSTNSEKFTGTGTPPGGTAGTIVATPGTGTNTYTQTQTQQSCETDQQTTTDQQAPGTVQVQSVAVLVNSRALPKGVSLGQLQAGVAAAAGINPARGDTLAFSAMPFSTGESQQAAAAAKAAAAAAKKRSLEHEATVGIVVLAVLAALFLLWRSARKARGGEEVYMEPMGPMDALAGLSLAELPSEPTGQLPAVGPEREEPLAGELSTVQRFVDSQPDDVATMLRSWMRERSGAKG
jgi:flagellar M-ring protein FliF